MAWWRAAATHVWVFSVGRGNAAFVRSALNHGFLVDMGTEKGFSPADFVEKRLVPELTKYEDRSIAQAVLSHPHSDHISECGRIEDKAAALYPHFLTCPHDKPSKGGADNERLNWGRIKNPTGSDKLIATYRRLYTGREPPLRTLGYVQAGASPNLEYGLFYLRPPIAERVYPKDDNKYGNATSLVVYWRQGDKSVLLPGDVTPEALKMVLDGIPGREKRYTVFDRTGGGGVDWSSKNSNQPELGALLKDQGLSVLLAPHHGLESCYSEDLYAAIKGGKPRLVVISERRHKGPEDGTIDARYQSERGASGWMVNIEGQEKKLRSVSTVNGHHFLIVMQSGAPLKVYGSRDPDWLLKQI